MIIDTKLTLPQMLERLGTPYETVKGEVPLDIAGPLAKEGFDNLAHLILNWNAVLKSVVTQEIQDRYGTLQLTTEAELGKEAAAFMDTALWFSDQGLIVPSSREYSDEFVHGLVVSKHITVPLTEALEAIFKSNSYPEGLVTINFSRFYGKGGFVYSLTEPHHTNTASLVKAIEAENKPSVESKVTVGFGEAPNGAHILYQLPLE